MSKVYKVAFNACYGGFSLGENVLRRYAEAKNIDLTGSVYSCGSFETKSPYRRILCSRSIPRHDPELIRIIEQEQDKGDDESLDCIGICTISTPVYRIDSHDGLESVELPEGDDWVVIE